jgi:DNA-binding beta-propeller fold protein YncE
MTSPIRFEIDSSPASVQRITPQSRSERFEGVDFSASGDILAIATSETNSVLLFRRGTDGRFETTPYQTIGRAPAALKYPHDVSFSTSDDGGLLAVAQRPGTIAIYAKTGANGNYTSAPVFDITGPQSKLAFSDGVAFVPPDDAYIAACNLELATISFFRRLSRSPARFDTTPALVLRHKSIFHPDGLGFSRCGRWLAIANHGQQTVAIFRRRNRLLAGGRLSYGRWPVMVIADPRLRYPHSVAFTPQTDHLVVTNAGANYFNAYAPRRGWLGTRWSQTPVSQVIAHDDAIFKEVNTADKTEGGPKGVAINGTTLAVCSPQIGIKIYSFREG